MVDIPAGITYGQHPAGGFELALSPDGTRLVFAAVENGQRMLYLRDLRQSAVQPIRGSQDAFNPFFSPDGGWLGFFHESGGSGVNSLKKIPIQGGSPTTIAENVWIGGGAWAPNDMIVFAKRTSPGILTRR